MATLQEAIQANRDGRRVRQKYTPKWIEPGEIDYCTFSVRHILEDWQIETAPITVQFNCQFDYEDLTGRDGITRKTLYPVGLTGDDNLEILKLRYKNINWKIVATEIK